MSTEFQRNGVRCCVERRGSAFTLLVWSGYANAGQGGYVALLHYHKRQGAYVYRDNTITVHASTHEQMADFAIRYAPKSDVLKGVTRRFYRGFQRIEG
jgi:hypothetical protein